MREVRVVNNILIKFQWCLLALGFGFADGSCDYYLKWRFTTG
jgi:hypothetical protein